MTRAPSALTRSLFACYLSLSLAGSTFAGDPPRRARRVVITSAAVHPCPPPRPVNQTLGTFYPTPYITVRGNVPLGGGYSPLEIYGDQTLPIYGPLSAFRSSTAPVLSYVRGYDGQTRLTEAASFSSPNLPILSPVRYPTVGNYYYGPRRPQTMPWGNNAINWIDQN
jgi:hypothetical protein